MFAKALCDKELLQMLFAERFIECLPSLQETTLSSNASKKSTLVLQTTFQSITELRIQSTTPQVATLQSVTLQNTAKLQSTTQLQRHRSPPGRHCNMLWRSCGLLLSAKEDLTRACACTYLPAKSTRQLKDAFAGLELPRSVPRCPCLRNESASKTCNTMM